MVVAATKLMTVAEFQALPEASGEFVYELQRGEVVPMTRPKLKHSILQRRLFKLLEGAAEPLGWLDTEMAFRALPEHELRAADVAFVRQERFSATDPEDNIAGSPDLIIEVLSPSNSASEMYEREELCLSTGCAEFWVVDPERQTVRVAKPGGSFAVYHSGEQIPLPLLGHGTLAVDSIFLTPPK
jgi:Uma2 family endonuclease